jgi:hypothetical protein
MPFHGDLWVSPGLRKCKGKGKELTKSRFLWTRPSHFMTHSIVAAYAVGLDRKETSIKDLFIFILIWPGSQERNNNA